MRRPGGRPWHAPRRADGEYAETDAAVRRPAVPRLAAARVRPLRRRGIPAADRPSLGRGGGARAGAVVAAAARGAHRDLRGADARRHRRRGVPCARPARPAVPAVQRRFAVRLQPRRVCWPPPRRRAGGHRQACCCAGWTTHRATASWSWQGDRVSEFRERPACRHGRRDQRRHLPVQSQPDRRTDRQPVRWSATSCRASPHGARCAARWADGYFLDIGIPEDFARAQPGDSRACCAAARCSWTATA